MSKNNLTKNDIDENVLISDFLIGMGSRYFGQHLRLKENGRWRYWHDEWLKNPDLEKDKYDYFQMESRKEKRKK